MEHGGSSRASKLAEMEAALHHAFRLRLPPNLPEKCETQNLVESNGYSRIMAKLSDALFNDIAAKYSNITADQLKCRIQRGLQEHFPSLHTPTHPTYAMMIQRAIEELGEEEGSREEAISDFIKRKYEDLPLAHVTFLQRYLGKLCESGELVSSNGRYKIPVRDERVLKRKTKRGRGRRRVKTKRHKAGVDVGDFDREKQPLEIGSQLYCKVKELGVEWPEERDGAGGNGIEEAEDEQGRGRCAEGVNESNVGDGKTELVAEEKEMETKEGNDERLFGDRIISELDDTNSNNGEEENARNVEECLGEKMERALDEDSRLQEKEEFKDEKNSFENPQQSLKPFPVVESTITEAGETKEEHPRQGGRGRLPRRKAVHEKKENFEPILPLKPRSRGRPPKPKLNPDQQSNEDEQHQFQNKDSSPQSSFLRLRGKSMGRGRPCKTNQAAVLALEALPASNLEQNLQNQSQVSCPSRETDTATLLQSKRPRRERRPPKCFEVIK